jgi:hypothetical protein
MKREEENIEHRTSNRVKGFASRGETLNIE